MKRFLALAMAGAMLISSSVFAAESPTTGSVIAAADGTSVVVTKEVKAEATSANLSVAEYVNNIVATVPGLETALPVAQAGSVIINGVKTPGKINLTKPTVAEAKAVKAMATAMNGKALACVGIKPTFQFNTCQTTLAVAGIKAGSKLVAFQMINGQAVPVKINAVTDNFLDVTLTGVGQLVVVELN